MLALDACNALFLLLAFLTSSYAARSRFDAGGSLVNSHKPDVPDWLVNMKDTIRLAQIFPAKDHLAAIESQTHVRNYTINKKSVLITPDHMQALTPFVESAYGIHLERDRVFIDFTELSLSLRVYIKHMSFLSGSHNYIDANLTGGLRAGWELEYGLVESGTWVPMCSCDGSASDPATGRMLPTLDGVAEFHLNAAYTEKMRKSLFPDPKAIVQDIICAEIKFVLETYQDVYMEKMKNFYQSRIFFSSKHEGSGPPGTDLLSVERQTWHYTPPRNLGRDCGKFGCRGGECPYCGGGFCCKKGSFRGGCDGSSGNVSQHICTVVPKKPTATENAGAECWNAADCRSGSCGYCGLGLCCRKGWASGGCDGKVGGVKRHECVALRSGSSLLDKIPSQELRQALLMEDVWFNPSM